MYNLNSRSRALLCDRHETITYTDDDQARLAEEGFQTLAQLDDISLMVDSTGGEVGRRRGAGGGGDGDARSATDS